MLSKEEAYKQYLQKEENKKIVANFWEFCNNKEFDKARLLLSDTVQFDQDIFHPEVGRLMDIEEEFNRKIRGRNNDIIRKMVANDPEFDIEYSISSRVLGADEIIQLIKMERKYEQKEIEILEIIADGDIVWVTAKMTVISLLINQKIEGLYHLKSIVKDGKITEYRPLFHHLGLFIQTGHVIINEGDRELIADYLDNLRSFGLLSDKKSE
ncbi:MAG: nuclear transport factor 2 family protein [Candidatus Kariarchaeaceae archaeon]